MLSILIICHDIQIPYDQNIEDVDTLTMSFRVWDAGLKESYYSIFVGNIEF